MPMRASLAILVWCGLASGASAMDCGTAGTVVEKGICASPEFTARRDEIDKLLAEVRGFSAPSEQQMLDRAQSLWTRELEDNCGELDEDSLPDCLSEVLDHRLAELKATPDSGPGGDRMIPVYVLQTGDARHYALQAAVYRFAQPKSDGQKLFNAAIAAILAKLPLGPQEFPNADQILESDTSMTVKYASPTLISASHFWWLDGGAHGNGGVSNININLATGKELTLADMVSEQAAGELRKQCREQLIAQKKEMVDENYDPSTDQFFRDEVIAEHVATLSRWSLSAEDVSILFDPYAIGAYVEGDYQCTFPLQQFKALALPTAPLP